MNDKQKMSTREFVSAIISGAIVLGAVIYWIIQVQGVLESFKLEGGG
jgi:hypothetical protein